MEHGGGASTSAQPTMLMHVGDGITGRCTNRVHVVSRVHFPRAMGGEPLCRSPGGTVFWQARITQLMPPVTGPFWVCLGVACPRREIDGDITRDAITWGWASNGSSYVGNTGVGAACSRAGPWHEWNDCEDGELLVLKVEPRQVSMKVQRTGQVLTMGMPGDPLDLRALVTMKDVCSVTLSEVLPGSPLEFDSPSLESEIGLLLTGDCFSDHECTFRVSSVAELTTGIEEILPTLGPWEFPSAIPHGGSGAADDEAAAQQETEQSNGDPPLAMSELRRLRLQRFDPRNQTVSGPPTEHDSQICESVPPGPVPEQVPPQPEPQPGPSRVIHCIEVWCPSTQRYRALDVGDATLSVARCQHFMYHGVSKLELYVHTRPMMAPADSLLQACEHLDVDLISSCLRQEHANAVVPGDRGGHTLLYHVVDRQITPFGEDLRPIPAGSPPPESDFHSTAARVNIIVKKFTDLGADVHRIGQMYNVPRGLDPSYIRRADARLTREPVLVCACRQGLAPVVHTLLAAHANPNSMGDDGISSLMQATISGAAGCVSALLAAGADPNYSVFSDQPSTFQVPGMLGWSAADFLFSPRYFRGDTTARVDVASALISGNGGCTRLRQPAVLVKVAHSAANAGSVQTLQAVLQIAGSQQDTILSSRDESERNLLHAAADQGHSNVVTLVCETGAGMQELLRQADSQSLLPAHYAARGGHPNILVAIGQLGFADTFCVPDHRGRTAIQLAVERGHSGHGGDDCVAACLSFDPSKTMLRTIKTMDLDIRASGLRARCRGIVNYAPARQLCIDRSSIIFATLELIKDIAADNLRDPIKIEFAGEAGSDAGGLTREFFKCFGESLAVPNEKGLRLFRLSTRGMLVPCSSVLLAAQHSTVAVAQHDGVVSLLESEPESISPSEQQLDDTLVAHFVAAGRVAGMALLHGELLGRPFAPYFIRLVCNDPPKCLADLQAEFSAAEVAGPDHGDIRGSSEILQRTLSDLHLDDTLTMTRTLTGSKVEVELVPNGADIAVTNLNKTEWLQRSLHHKIVRDIQRQADAFRQGVLQVLPEGLLDWFTAEELAKLWGGHSIDDHQLAAWQANTRVDAASEQEAELLWAWLAVQACERRAQVLAFITGSSTIPIEGFSSLHPPLCIIREEQPTVIKGMPVPTVSTCFNALRLPTYLTREALGQGMDLALEWGSGFGLA